MPAHTLATESQLRNWIATTSYSSSWTSDSASIRRLLEVATREIEAYCGNQGSFGPTYSTTLEFDEGSGNLLDDPRPVLWNGTRASKMPLPWLISVSSATLYSGTARTSSTALVEDTDYVLTPYSGFPPAFDAPYIGMKYKDGSSNTNPFSESGLKVLAIAGTWGWSTQTVSDTTLNGSINSTTKTIVVADAANLSAAQTILVNSEAIYIESISSNTLTVERSVSGTTAASHSSSDQVYYFTYPPTITQTCLQLSTNMWVDRVGGLQDEITIAGAEFSSVQNERRNILKNIDSYATHGATAGVTF